MAVIENLHDHRLAAEKAKHGSVAAADVLIIGAGPVGLFAVFACGQLGLSSVVVDVLEHPGGQCATLYPDKPIYDIPSRRSITGQGLINELLEQAAPYSPQYIFGSHVAEITGSLEAGWKVTTHKGDKISCRFVIIAGGNGIFEPVRPPIDDIHAFEGSSVFYCVNRTEAFAGKRIAIAGGGDSALDWALAMGNIADKLYLIHRRPRFRGAPASVAALQELMSCGKVEVIAPFQLSHLEGGDGVLEAVHVRATSGEVRRLEAEVLLPFFGMQTDVGPLAGWGIEMHNDRFIVNPATCMTSREGIFAIGDIACYPSKLGLILSGFSEAATAAHTAHALMNPDVHLHFEHSTTRGDPALKLQAIAL